MTACCFQKTRLTDFLIDKKQIKPQISLLNLADKNFDNYYTETKLTIFFTSCIIKKLTRSLRFTSLPNLFIGTQGPTMQRL